MKKKVAKTAKESKDVTWNEILLLENCEFSRNRRYRIDLLSLGLLAPSTFFRTPRTFSRCYIYPMPVRATYNEGLQPVYK